MNSCQNLPFSNRTSFASAMALHYPAAIDVVHCLQIPLVPTAPHSLPPWHRTTVPHQYHIDIVEYQYHSNIILISFWHLIDWYRIDITSHWYHSNSISYWYCIDIVLISYWYCIAIDIDPKIMNKLVDDTLYKIKCILSLSFNNIILSNNLSAR